MKSAFIVLIVAVVMIGVMVPTVLAANNDSELDILFPPHFHNELEISINSEDPIMFSLQDSKKTNVISHVGDTIQITVSVGDDSGVENISQIKLITNFAPKPSGMNNYYANNYDDYRQVGLSVYEWKQHHDDQHYDYAGTLSWGDPVTLTQERTQENHEYTGWERSKEKELLVTFL